jgi:hypothetical protein
MDDEKLKKDVERLKPSTVRSSEAVAGELILRQ